MLSLASIMGEVPAYTKMAAAACPLTQDFGSNSDRVFRSWEKK